MLVYGLEFQDDLLTRSNGLIPRDFQTDVRPNATQRTTLIVAGIYILAIAVLW